MRDLASTFSALADPTRLEMLALLLENGELCVCDFVGTLGVSQSKASRHLRYLWNSGLLQDRRAGLWVFYRISPELAPDGKAIVEALRSIFGERDLTALRDRLQRWRRRKAKDGATAKAVPRKTARAEGWR
jgi:ArsR family transcriptional regulator, arsenate/arsenite/antimonite-responsive transcriptional repressor